MKLPLISEDELLISDDGDEQELFEHYCFTVDKGQSPLRIDKFLTAHIEGISRHRIQLAAKADYIVVNGKPIKSNYAVKPSDEISIMMPYRRRGLEIFPENIPLNILYEDDALMVIDKPAGLVVHPGHGNYSGTLLNGLKYYLRDFEESDGILVHRIDKNTSGVMVVAKTEEAQLFLAKQFFNHVSKRVYVALVWGNLKEDEGTITGNIARHPNDRMRFIVFPEGDKGRHAVTHYKVIERLGYVTLVECRLETGRTHQIRVHMNYISHPLFNDERYGGDSIVKGTTFAKYKQFVENCFAIMPRHALHARLLGFTHPVSKKEMIFESPIPKDFEQVLTKWRTYSDTKK